MKLIQSLVLALGCCIILFHCNSKKVESSEQPEQVNAGNSKLISLIELSRSEKIELPEELTAVITGDTTLRYSFFVLRQAQAMSNGTWFGFYGRSFGCTPIACALDIYMLEFNEQEIIHRGNTQIQTWQEKGEFSFLHETFFLANSTFQYADSEPDVNSPPVEYPIETESRCLALFNGKIAPLEEFSQPDLLLLRNLIFARYGHQFKLDSLRVYFSQFDWYKPVSSNVSDKISADDRTIVAMILEAEKGFSKKIAP